MNNMSAKDRFGIFKRLMTIVLVIGQITISIPVSDALVMESVNFKVNASIVSSGLGQDTGIVADIRYSNLGDACVGSTESASYKVSLGVINSVESNPPVALAPIPDAGMKIVWDRGAPCASTISLDSYFRSPDNSPLTYEVENTSAINVAIDPAAHRAAFSADSQFYGSACVRFIALDNNGNRTYSNYVVLSVRKASDNLPIICPISDITVNENEPVAVSPVVFDPDGDVLTISYTAPLDSNGAWLPTYSDEGTYRVKATVTDGSLTSSTSFNIIVKNVNRPPVINPIPDIAVNEGDIIKLNITSFDPDGDNVTVSYPQPFDVDGSWKTLQTDAGSYSFKVRVSDGSLTAGRDFNVTINPVNTAPSLKIYANKTTVASNEEFTVHVLADDPDNDRLLLTLKLNGSAIAGCADIPLESDEYAKSMSIASYGSHTIEAVVEEVDVSGTPNVSTETIKINVDEMSPKENYFPITGDFNGDGLTDLGYYNRKLGIWKVELSKGDGSFGPLEYWISASSDFGVDNQWFYPLTGDFNGDGKTDVGFMRVPTSQATGTSRAYMRIAVSNSSSFDIISGEWRNTDSCRLLYQDWHFVAMSGDYNGDGLSDIVQVNTNDNHTHYVGFTSNDLSAENVREWQASGSYVITGFSASSADFNGDGLSDICLFKKTGGEAAVALSDGKSFGVIAQWINNFGDGKDHIFADFNCDGLTDIGYTEKENGKWVIKYALSDGTQFKLNNGSPYVYRTDISDTIDGMFTTADFNGDGLFDVAVFDKDAHAWSVNLHHSKYPDLLVSIDNGVGSTTAITYKDSVIFENKNVDGSPSMPFSIRVVTEVAQSDGIGNTYTTRYFYKDGYFDTQEREFRGFGYVKVIDAESSCKETYFRQDDICKGRPSKEVVRDKYDRVYSDVRYNWQCKTGTVPGNFIPYLQDKTSTAFDPATGLTKSSRSVFTYDDYGNAVNVRDEGFLDVKGDERESSVEYMYDTVKWILSKPVESRIKGSNGALAAATRYEYYADGSLKKEERYLGDSGGEPNWGEPTNPTAVFTYDAAGNIETSQDAKGNITSTTYDPTKTFPVTVQNALGHTQAFTYDKTTGKILTSTDPNGQTSVSEYDGFGRLIRVVGPGGISETAYSYDLASSPVKIITKIGTVYTYAFIDGLGRQVLSRSEAEYKGTAKHIVSGEVGYDSRGQVIRKYLPYYIDAPTPADTYIPPQNSTPYVRYEYDPMGRLVKTIRPDNKTSYTIYGVDTIEAVNENGQHAKEIKDAYGRIIEVEEDNGRLTNYVYDVLGNLTDTYDSASPRNNVHMEYDTLGRKVSMTDPDMGNWHYYYDKVGNLTSQVDAKGQTINFEYDAINRLVRKWGLSPQGTVPVFYIYDDASKPNCVGRLSKVTDSSGSTEFFYDILGREIKTAKVIWTVPGGGSPQGGDCPYYTIERTFDSLDRLTTVKYPDNSVVGYSYNKQGGIDKIGTVPGLGSPLGGDCSYFVSSVDYNANGQIERINYGNGTYTDYAYDPYNFRLEELKTSLRGAPGGGDEAIQHLSYNFDPIGNVTSILDSSPNGTNTQHFQYDNLNRLVYSNGASYGVVNYSYDSIGNLLTKGNLTMQYGVTAGPHAVTTVKKWGLSPGGGMTEMGTVPIFYDANGNMTQKGSSTFEYDIENRLKKVTTEKGAEPFDLTLNFTEGWNFFSIPGYIPNTGGSIKDILLSIEGKYDQVSTYDTSQGKWLHYVGDAKFNQFDKLEIGRGYLIYITEPCSITLTGNYPLYATRYTLKQGWNLVSAPTDSEMIPSRAFRDVTYDSIAVHNGVDYTYEPDTIYTGKAYWVHVNSNQDWSVPLKDIETTYAYDGDGGRVMRTVRKIGTVPDFTTVYVGSSFELEGPAGQSADKVTKHIFMGSTRVCSIETTTSTRIYYYHQDHIGSSNVITDESGNIVQILEYSPYGEVSRNTGNYPSTGLGIKYSTDKRFTGKIWDESSALSYFGARYYDPELGRFITADPTIARPFDPQDLNRYSYCRNNPINYIDPTGLSWWSKFWDWFTGGVGAIVAAVAIMAVTLCAAVATGGAAIANPMFWTFAGEISGAFSGGIAAAVSGGNVGRGLLTGTIAGGISGGALGPPGSITETVLTPAEACTVTGGLESGFTIGYSIATSEVTRHTASMASIALHSIATSGAGAGRAVINEMVSNAYAAENDGNKKDGLYRGYSGIVTNNDFHEGFQIISNDNTISGRWEFDVYPKTPLVKADASRGRFVLGTWYERTDPFDTLKFVSDNVNVMKAARIDVQSRLGKIEIYNIYGIPGNCRTATNQLINRAKKTGN